jgi:hypothetical protein
MLQTRLRRSGLDPIGDLPWASHICSFYQTKEDLLEILVPYMAAGLAANERCFWVTADPLTVQDAAAALRAEVPSFDRYAEEGRIVIVPHDEWYVLNGVFDMERVLASWAAEVDEALLRGYEGLRVTGNTAWLETKDWDAFAEYEKTIDSAIEGSPILVL